MKGTAAGRLARSSWGALAEGWRATPPDDRTRFWVRLALATVLATAASGATAWLFSRQASDGLLPGDVVLDRWMDGLLSVHSALWLGAFTSSAMVTPLLVLAMVLQARRGRWERAVMAVAAYVASKAIILVGWATWDRARPADVGGGELVPVDMPSYPSGHSVQTWTIYGLFVLWWAAASDRWWERALAWALLLFGSLAIAVARVRLGAHYPSDVLAGIALAALWLAGAAWADRALRAARRD